LSPKKPFRDPGDTTGLPQVVVRRPVPARKESAATAARLSCPKDLNPALAQPVVRVVEGPRERCGTWLGNIALGLAVAGAGIL
jgi:hypothetical protein